MPGPYQELDAIAASLGLPPPGHTLTIRHGDLPLEVSLDINSGSVMGLKVVARGRPLPAVRLRTETAGDRRGKAVGLNREVQTGDAHFDALVYVDSDAPDAVVLALLAPPAARRAVLALLACYPSLELGPAGVALESGWHHPDPYDPARFQHALAHLVALLAALAPVPVPPPERPRPAGRGTRAAAWLLLGSWVVFLCMAFIAPTQWRPVALAHGIVAGLALGLAAWVLSAGLIFLAVRGRSSSRTDFIGYVIASCLYFLPAGVALLVALNAALDAAPPEVHTLPIVATRPFTTDDDAHCLEARVRAPGDAEGTLSFPFCHSLDRITPGQALLVTIRQGALGFPWVDGARTAPR